MHELSIAQNIIEIVNDNLNDHQKNIVKSVRVKVGKLTNILPDSLVFSFEALVKDTDLDGAVLEIEHLPIKIKCAECGAVSTSDDFLFSCEKCGGNQIKILSGNEFLVSEIELND
ncbi:MAG: hydrogenase maturation nickel metallochaperone HypA [Calditrichia bacterium]|jgi:hydrogenase nickel incorporation protein HypA/HybF